MVAPERLPLRNGRSVDAEQTQELAGPALAPAAWRWTQQ
jgi:hypothetical protein